MSERGGDDPAGTVPVGKSDLARQAFRTDLDVRSTRVRSVAPVQIPDPASRAVRLRAADSFSFGIEEEFFVVDAETKAIVLKRPPGFLDDAKRELGDQVRVEMLQSQIEISTLPHVDIGTARAELKFLRDSVARAAARHGLAIVASGTYPTADWWHAQPSDGARYD